MEHDRTAPECWRRVIIPHPLAKDFDPKDLILDNLSRLNVFIGPNNSGKSRLLRSLFRDDDNLQFATNVDEESKLHRLIERVKPFRDKLKSKELPRFFRNPAGNFMLEPNIQLNFGSYRTVGLDLNAVASINDLEHAYKNKALTTPPLKAVSVYPCHAGIAATTGSRP